MGLSQLSGGRGLITLAAEMGGGCATSVQTIRTVRPDEEAASFVGVGTARTVGRLQLHARLCGPSHEGAGTPPPERPGGVCRSSGRRTTRRGRELRPGERTESPRQVPSGGLRSGFAASADGATGEALLLFVGVREIVYWGHCLWLITDGWFGRWSDWDSQ